VAVVAVVLVAFVELVERVVDVVVPVVVRVVEVVLVVRIVSRLRLSFFVTLVVVVSPGSVEASAEFLEKPSIATDPAMHAAKKSVFFMAGME
jgi:hypothetical protein